MRALVCTAPGVAEVMDVSRPRPLDGEVEIAVEAAGICGLDAAAFAGRSRIASLPAILGHELAGRLSDGQRVVVNPFLACGQCAPCLRGATNLCANWQLLGSKGLPGCFAEFVCLPRTQVCVLPHSLTSMRAVLAEPLANVVHLLRLATMHPGRRVAIVGAGLMGSLALQAALRADACAVSIVEPIAVRRAAALAMGAAAACASAEEALSAAGDGYDLVIDACGSGSAREIALALCRPGGVAAFLGMTDRQTQVDWNTAIRRELRLQTAFGFTHDDFARAVDLLAADEINLDAWTEVWELGDGQQALQAACTERTKILKHILRIA